MWLRSRGRRITSAYRLQASRTSEQHTAWSQVPQEGILSAEVCRRNIQCDPSGKTYCREKPRDSREDLVRAVRAAYYGMIEFEDSCVGTVRAAWTDYLSRTP